MFQSQGDQRATQSGFKQRDYHRNDSLIPFTIRMIQKIAVVNDQPEFEGMGLSYVSLVARIQQYQQLDKRNIVQLCDDTGMLDVTIIDSGSKFKQILAIVQNEDNWRMSYVKVILNLRVTKGQLHWDLQNLTLIDEQQTNLILFHMIQVCLFKTKRSSAHNTSKLNQSRAGPQIFGEEIRRDDQKLENQILGFIQTQLNQFNQEVSLQAIVNEFSKNYPISTVKKEISELKLNNQICEGSQAGTFRIA